MLDAAILRQVTDIFSQLENDFTFRICYDSNRAESNTLIDFLYDLASCSDKLSCSKTATSDNQLKFSILKNGEETGITFRGIPNGHEFTSLLLAILNADGKGKNWPDEGIAKRIKNLSGEISITTYVSLTCTNCPDIVQTLNLMALINPNIRHEMVDGALFQDEVEQLKIQAVPTIYANGELLHIGRSSMGELLDKLEARFPASQQVEETTYDQFDTIILGGGPAGVAAAIYLARKGLQVAVVAERIGGQVKETVGIENLITIPYTTGTELANNLKLHLNNNNIKIFENRIIQSVDLTQEQKTVRTKGGEIFTSKAIIIATGASWRRLNVEGEAEYIGKGVAFCPHCDGPFYAGKDVAVIGGGNSGVEAAIDLAGICRSVTIIEFLDTLKADKVLQEKANSLPNVKTLTSTMTMSIEGDADKVTSLRLKERNTEEVQTLPIDGIFVQIGLNPNSDIFNDGLAKGVTGEIIIDSHCRTNIPGVYAAGDVTSVPYKQIVIAMGEGAKAALSVFEDIVRGVI